MRLTLDITKVEIWPLHSLDYQEKPSPVRAAPGCVDLEEPVYTGQTNQPVDNSPTLCKNKKFLKRWVLELSTSFAKETQSVVDFRQTAPVRV